MVKDCLFINESPVYGGHEEMFLRLLASLDIASDDEVTLLVNARNEKLIERASQITGIKVNVITHSFLGLPVRPLTNLLAVRDAWSMFKLIRRGGYRKVMVVQGTIEIGGLSLLVARLSGRQVISYIPVTKRSGSLGVSLGRCRDFINKIFYYPLPHAFITISAFNRQELIDDFGVAPEKIEIVHNFVEEVALSDAEEQPLVLPAGRNFLLIGRIDFLQKRQKEFLAAFAGAASRGDVTLHIVGDNDSPQSDELRAAYGHHSAVRFHGWQTQTQIHRLLAAADGIILPSRFEGVPLVMIEAVNMARVVFASNVDGMKEFLPPQWLFEVNDFDRAVQMMVEYAPDSAAVRQSMEAVRERFERTFNAHASAAAFQTLISR